MKPKQFYTMHYKESKETDRVHFAMFFSDINSRILDVGCSNGNFLIHCSKESKGIDNDFASVEMAVRRGLNAELCDLDKQRLPYPDNYFDAVNFVSTIEHFQHPLNSLIEVRRVLKPGAKLVLRTRNLRYWGFLFWRNYNNYTPFMKESLEHILLDAGFENFKIKYIRRGMFGARKMFDLGVNPLLIKKLMLFFGFFRREYLLVELKNEI